ncbi:hypothetical protein OIU34_22535 [Pararhizobium sp. BT-229]|uniref:hypothetical protein n=1 Tax=Pararhizobium sp. BT-229 TaxID=2986923 RepID=UPI0021F6CB27|nr:hypothetical protein [Pararhizobium sp. BT-229]MCV9964672.1 hypothetical protein [Pararhizobium sp. BT-229]
MSLKLSNYVRNRPMKREEAITQLASWLHENAEMLDFEGATLDQSREIAEQMCDGTWLPPSVREDIEAVNAVLQKRFS